MHCAYEHAHYCPHELILYIHIYIYCECMLEGGKHIFLNEAFLLKIMNSNIMPTLCGFRWYPYFGAQV